MERERESRSVGEANPFPPVLIFRSRCDTYMYTYMYVYIYVYIYMYMCVYDIYIY